MGANMFDTVRVEVASDVNIYEGFSEDVAEALLDSMCDNFALMGVNSWFSGDGTISVHCTVVVPGYVEDSLSFAVVVVDEAVSRGLGDIVGFELWTRLVG